MRGATTARKKYILPTGPSFTKKDIVEYEVYEDLTRIYPKLYSS